MALPPALLARLQKRGIVKQDEEVIAENYDAKNTTNQTDDEPGGAPGCPNKYNPYHLCVQYCYDHWNDGTPEYRVPEKYLKLKERMLAKFPLPENWIEVYDAGIARYYYWNQDSDEVCWLSPKHPRAVIGEAAPKLAREVTEFAPSTIASKNEKPARRDERSRDDHGFPNKGRSDDRDRDRGRDRDSKRSERGERRRKKDSESDGGEEDPMEMTDRDRLKRARRKGLDPMDPAAYGDAPAGKWSSGLNAHDNTGADVTASGPLFQQRPYPAPGAVLRGKKPE